MQTLHLIDVTLRTLHYGRFIFSAITSSITLLSLRYRFCELSLASYHFAITFWGAITFVLVLSYHLSDSQSDRVVYQISYLIDYQFCSADVDVRMSVPARGLGGGEGGEDMGRD